MSSERCLAVLGGSGLYELEGLSTAEEIRLDTPFGPPSDVIVRGRIHGTPTLFLNRHGRGHRILPQHVNSRANIAALKMLGATHLLGVGAVGSLREEIRPGDLVVVDQFIDLTKHRVSTFFEDGLVAHVAFAQPVCPDLSTALAAAAETSGAARTHMGGTYVCIEGPQFSTRAESHLFRSWGAHVIGMTAAPEAKLAREAELPYALLALATDYDCWKCGEGHVTADAVRDVMAHNVALARRAIVDVAQRLPDPALSVAAGALRGALMTAKDRIPSTTLERLAWLVGPYIH